MFFLGKKNELLFGLSNICTRYIYTIFLGEIIYIYIRNFKHSTKDFIYFLESNKTQSRAWNLENYFEDPKIGTS